MSTRPRHPTQKNTRRTGKLLFTFDYKKSTQALNYLAVQAGGRINKMKALKLIYFADRFHLRKYGRLITMDSYLAMAHGPVPSSTKDIAECTDYLNDEVKDYSAIYIRPVGNLEYKSIKPVDRDVFSTSDIEALSFSWHAFGKLTQFQLRDLTHLYPEWKKLEGDLKLSPCVSMNVFDFLEDPITNVDKCSKLNEEDKEAIVDELVETAHIQSLWR